MEAVSKKKEFENKHLHKITFFQYLISVFDYETALFMKDAFGYDSEFLELNADAAIQMFEEDLFSENNYSVLMGGFSQVIDKLVIYPDNMLANMNKFRGLVMSQRVLLALTQAGVSREDSYRLVQRNAMKVWEDNKDFKTELLADDEVRAALSEAEIEEKFDLGYHTKHVDTIFNRVFGAG